MVINFVKIGKILKPKGFLGEMKVSFDFEILDTSIKAFFFYQNNSYIPIIIEKLSIGELENIIKLKNYNTKEEAIKLNNLEIFINKDNSLKFFDIIEESDFLDYKIYNDGIYVGKIVELIKTKSQNTFMVESIENESILIPFVKPWILEMDNNNKHIFFSLPDGLLDINKNA